MIEFGPAELVGSVVGGILTIAWILNKISTRLKWTGNGNNGAPEYRTNKILAEQTTILRDMKDILKSQSADHQIQRMLLEDIKHKGD